MVGIFAKIFGAVMNFFYLFYKRKKTEDKSGFHLAPKRNSIP